MSNWEKQSLGLTGIIGAVIIIGSFPFSRSISMGILLGIVFGFVRHLLLRNYVDTIFGIQNFSVFQFILYFLGNFGMLAVPFYIGSVYPDFVNVFGAAIGLSLHKFMIYVSQFITDRKER